MFYRKYIFIASLFLVFLGTNPQMQAQEKMTIYGLQTGYSMSNQRWESFNRDALFKPHLDFIYESQDINNGYSFYSSLGYHTRGSATRGNNFINLNTGNSERFVEEMKIYNIVVNLGVKKRAIKSSGNALYYLLALRGEVSIDQDFDFYEALEDDVNRFVAGVTLGFGYEWVVPSKGTVIAGFSIQPDFTNQIFVQPGIVQNTFTGQNERVDQEEIRNFSIELSVGFLFYNQKDF